MKTKKSITLLILSLLLFNGITQAGKNSITYYQDVMPIINKKCLQCHHANGYSTIELDNYEKVRNYAKTIQNVLKKNLMPPWKADTGYSHFSNERFLTKSEKNKIYSWILNKMPVGKVVSSNSSYPVQYSNKSRINRTPDMVLHFPSSVNIKNNSKDMFVYVKIPYEIKNDTIAEAIEFIPDNIKYLHHLNFKIFDADSLQNNYLDGENKLETNREEITDVNKKDIYRKLHMLNNRGEIPENLYYGSWVPGMSSINLTNLPLGIKIPKKGVVLISLLHYAPSSEITTDSSSLNIFFKNRQIDSVYLVDHLVVGVSAGEKNTVEINKTILFIKPNIVQTFHYKCELKKDFIAINLNPHMHLLGVNIKAYAIYNSDTIPLINIPKWDFDWQELYILERPILLKKGTIVCLDATYDNTVNNLRNPFNPPRYISGDDGMQTNAEMMIMILQGIFPTSTMRLNFDYK